MYYQFLYNVIDSKVDDIIVPLPLPGAMGAIFLERYKAQPDLVYIDGCHDEECVYQDLQSWFPLLKEGGMLIGDDYGRKGVANAVARFCTSEQKCQLATDIMKGRTFVLRK